jgi:VanZ family protein
MSLLQSSRFRIASCLAWCLAWPAIAVLMLKPLPFGLISRTDLLGHFLLFALMTLTVLAFARSRAQIIALAVLSIGYGLALEFAQAYVPGRTFDAADAMANAFGGISGCLCALVLFGRLITPHARTKHPSHGQAC